MNPIRHKLSCGELALEFLHFIQVAIRQMLQDLPEDAQRFTDIDHYLMGIQSSRSKCRLDVECSPVKTLSRTEERVMEGMRNHHMIGYLQFIHGQRISLPS